MRIPLNFPEPTSQKCHGIWLFFHSPPNPPKISIPIQKYDYQIEADYTEEQNDFYADISVLLPVSPLYYDRPLSGGRKGGCELGPRPYFEKLWRKIF